MVRRASSFNRLQVLADCAASVKRKREASVSTAEPTAPVKPGPSNAGKSTALPTKTALPAPSRPPIPTAAALAAKPKASTPSVVPTAKRAKVLPTIKKRDPSDSAIPPPVSSAPNLLAMALARAKAQPAASNASNDLNTTAIDPLSANRVNKLNKKGHTVRFVDSVPNDTPGFRPMEDLYMIEARPETKEQVRLVHGQRSVRLTRGRMIRKITACRRTRWM
jgi:hypothetical protein